MPLPSLLNTITCSAGVVSQLLNIRRDDDNSWHVAHHAASFFTQHHHLLCRCSITTPQHPSRQQQLLTCCPPCRFLLYSTPSPALQVLFPHCSTILMTTASLDTLPTMPLPSFFNTLTCSAGVITFAQCVRSNVLKVLLFCSLYFIIRHNVPVAHL